MTAVDPGTGRHAHHRLLATLCWLFAGLPVLAAAGPAWVEALVSQRDAEAFGNAHPVEFDWLRQDLGMEGAERVAAGDLTDIGVTVVGRVLGELAPARDGPRREYDLLQQEGVAAGDPRWLLLYAHACEARRAQRLAKVRAEAPQIVFTRRRTVRPSFFAYTEAQSDAQAERSFIPGATLSLLTLEDTRGRVEDLLADNGGMIRDPAVSWDAKQLAFAWKKSLNDDDYHLYEMTLATRAIRQVTTGKGVADYEPAYLPNGDFIFASTRCVQTVDCFWTEVSNLYTCRPDGGMLRRLGFDQVHTVYPQVLDDGRVVYTRWDYNDRGQVFPQPLFQMNADGTGQGEYYGANSWFPTTIAHARGIPGSSRVLAVLCGHHSSQAGKLAVIDPSLGRQENQGVQLVSPVRETRAERIDGYGQDGELFGYPWPLDAQQWLVSYAPDGWEHRGRRNGDARFGIYWMDIDGRRELLVQDPLLPCQQPVVVAPRPRPPERAGAVDFHKDHGTYYVQNVYRGPGLEGVPAGTIKSLRVVALEFRSAGIRSNHSGGPGGGALISTPVAIGNGTWDVKRVLGETPVHEDGSAFFVVPARTPVYFQMLDDRGRTVQTMRSWSTLQPGENASCIGCHESPNSAPPALDRNTTLALRKPPQPLKPPQDPPRGFSFNREVQPVLDRHCVSCHNHREPVLAMAAGERPAVLRQPPEKRSLQRNQAFSLRKDTVDDPAAGRAWSDAYLVLTNATREGGPGGTGPFRGDPDGKVVNWISSQSVPTPLPPNTAGSTRSTLLELLGNDHYGVRLNQREQAAIACWIDLLVPFGGDYAEGNIWTEAEMAKFLRFEEKRRRLDAEDKQVAEELKNR